MTPRNLRPWKTLTKKTILKHNQFLTVESHSVELPDGTIIPDWAWVIIPDAVIVVAQTKERDFLCFRQTKYAIDGITLAPVGGMIEPGEDPLAAGKRELLEETGYDADEWEHLGSFWGDPNRGVLTSHLYLARKAEKIAEPRSDDLEDQQLVFLNQKALETALFNGEFKAIMWTTAVSLAMHFLNRKTQQS